MPLISIDLSFVAKMISENTSDRVLRDRPGLRAEPSWSEDPFGDAGTSVRFRPLPL
jgi:hypothetical protein